MSERVVRDELGWVGRHSEKRSINAPKFCIHIFKYFLIGGLYY